MGWGAKLHWGGGIEPQQTCANEPGGGGGLNDAGTKSGWGGATFPPGSSGSVNDTRFVAHYAVVMRSVKRYGAWCWVHTIAFQTAKAF